MSATITNRICGVDSWKFDYTSTSPATIILRSDGFEPVVHLYDSEGFAVGANYSNDEDGIYTARFDDLIQYETYTILVDYDNVESDGWGANRPR